MADKGTVSSRWNTSNNLEFYSKATGNVLMTLRGDTDCVEFPAGRVSQLASTTDIDTQNGTMTAAAIAGGIIIHTSNTAGGTLTFDTAANIIAAVPSLATLGATYDFIVVNDGDQTVTLANDAGPTVTISDTGQTIAINESALIRLINTGTGALAAHVVGA